VENNREGRTSTRTNQQKIPEKREKNLKLDLGAE